MQRSDLSTLPVRSTRNAVDTILLEIATPQSRVADTRYAWIEAEIERYDDLRKQCVVSASTLPLAPLMPAPDLALLRLAVPAPVKLSEDTLPLFKVEAVAAINASGVTEAVEADLPIMDALVLLTAEVNDIGTICDPFALTLTVPVPKMYASLCLGHMTERLKRENDRFPRFLPVTAC